MANNKPDVGGFDSDFDRGVFAVAEARQVLVELGLVEQIGTDEHGRPLWGLTAKARGMTGEEIERRMEAERTCSNERPAKK